ASLDSVSEQLVSLTLKAAMAGKMGIMVTHRVDQLDHMSSILVLDKGEIVQRGDFATLSTEAGLFQTMLHENTESVADIGLESPMPDNHSDIALGTTEGAAQ
ncbi:MAG: cysteine/glutathione ABC transporter permease/ATP-binding protein CydD, partial [Shewanella sp.]